MIRLLIFRFWPVLIPLILYALWFYMVGRKATIDGKPVLRFRDGPWYWLSLVSLSIGIVCFIFLANAGDNVKGQYIPPHMEGGKIIPGHVEQVP